MHAVHMQYVMLNIIRRIRFPKLNRLQFHSWQLEEIKSTLQQSSALPRLMALDLNCWTCNRFLKHPKWCLFFHHAWTDNKTCFRWHQFIIKLFSNELVLKKKLKKHAFTAASEHQQPFGCSINSSSQFRTSRSLSATTCLFSPHSNHVQEDQP